NLLNDLNLEASLALGCAVSAFFNVSPLFEGLVCGACYYRLVLVAGEQAHLFPLGRGSHACLVPLFTEVGGSIIAFVVYLFTVIVFPRLFLSHSSFLCWRCRGCSGCGQR